MEHKNFEDFNAISAKIKQEPMDDPLATEDLEERKAFVDSTTQTETYEEATELALLTNENKELKDQLLKLAAEEKSEISELKARVKQLNSRMFTRKTSKTIRRTIKNPDGSVIVTKTIINDPNPMPSLPSISQVGWQQFQMQPQPVVSFQCLKILHSSHLIVSSEKFEMSLNFELFL